MIHCTNHWERFQALSLWKVILTSCHLQVIFCLSWSTLSMWNTSHDSYTWPHFHTYVVSFSKSQTQICQVSYIILCLPSAPVSNHKCEDTCGYKDLCCVTLNVHSDITQVSAPKHSTHCHLLAIYGTSRRTVWYTTKKHLKNQTKKWKK